MYFGPNPAVIECTVSRMRTSSSDGTRGSEGTATSAGVDTAQRLCDADRLVAALALEGQEHRDLRAARDVVDALKLHPHADLRAHRERCREAQLVEPVVDAERDALQREEVVGEARRERQRVVAVRDRAAERRLLRALLVDVDELVVAGDLGERVDVLLRHELPLADADLLADLGLQLVDAVDRDLGCGSHWADDTRSSVGLALATSARRTTISEEGGSCGMHNSPRTSRGVGRGEFCMAYVHN